MRWTLRLALAGAAYSAGVMGWLVLPGDRPVPMLVWLVAFLGVFPVYGSALLFARRSWRARGAVAIHAVVARYRREGVSAPGSTVRRPDAVVAAVVATLAALIVIVLVLTAVAPLSQVPPGQPRIVDGRYMLSNHGVLTSVSRQVYLRALEGGQRGFVGMALLFYLVAALVVGTTARRLAAR